MFTFPKGRWYKPAMSNDTWRTEQGACTTEANDSVIRQVPFAPPSKDSAKGCTAFGGMLLTLAYFGRPKALNPPFCLSWGLRAFLFIKSFSESS